MDFEGKKIESQETEPKHNVVVADFLRHGETKYLEKTLSDEERKKIGDGIPYDLTAQGKRQTIKAAGEIIEKIDPQNEIVVLWSSPAWRAQGSEKIIRKLLEKKGVEIYKDSSLASTRNFDQYDDKLWDEIMPTMDAAEIAYSRDARFQEKNDKFETQPEVRIRAERVFNWIRYLAEHAELKGKKLHIIGVSHFEFLNPIMEDIFGYKVEEGRGIKKGENIAIEFNFDTVDKKMKISADFRGEHKDKINFDKKRRKFLTEK